MKNIKPVENIYCKYLKAKNPYGTTEGGGNQWFLADDINTICWCILSTGGAGPDNGLVEPMRCTKGRSCFTTPEE